MVTRSRTASARMSAHDTMPGQVSSRVVLARVTTSKASAEREWFISASRSATLKLLEATSIDASQPSTMQSWKKRRRVPAAVAGWADCFRVTVSRTILGNSGHVFL